MLFCKLILVAGTSPEIRFLKIWGKKKRNLAQAKKKQDGFLKARPCFKNLLA